MVCKVAYILLLLFVVESNGASYTKESQTCDTRWTSVITDPTACAVAAQSLAYLAAGAATPTDLPTSGALLRPLDQLPRGCILYENVVYTNPSGTDTALFTPGVSVFCLIFGPEPPEFNLPPFLAPWDNAPPVTPTLVVDVTLTVEIGETNAPPIPSTSTPVILGVTTPSPLEAAGPKLGKVSILKEQLSAGCARVEVKNVADANRAASSTWNGCVVANGGCVLSAGTPGEGLNRGRLDDAGWTAGQTVVGEYYEMDLGYTSLISGVVLQGGTTTTGAAGAWVTKATLQYSSDRVAWGDFENAKVYLASASYGTKVSLRSELNYRARYVRVYPQEWWQWMSLRAGILECTTFGGIEIIFDKATQQGTDAMLLPAADRVQPGINVAALFGVAGYRQTLGSVEGFTGQWVDSRAFVITFTESFNGVIDPTLASIYLREGTTIMDTDGRIAPLTGEANSMVFGESPNFSPLALPTASPIVAIPLTLAPSSGEANEGAYVLAAVIITAVPLSIFLGYMAWRYCRKQSYTRKYKRWVQEGRASANSRTPGGIASMRFQKIDEHGEQSRRASNQTQGGGGGGAAGGQPGLFTPQPLETSASWKTATPEGAAPPNPLDNTFGVRQTTKR